MTGAWGYAGERPKQRGSEVGRARGAKEGTGEKGHLGQERDELVGIY
jgi:hypothetical protein